MEQHSEMELEKYRLEETLYYMQAILQTSDENLKVAQEKIKVAMTNLEYIDSSDSFLNLLTNTRFLDMALNEKEALEKVLGKPYFARIDFEREHENRELLYIGKTSLFNRETHDPIIVDWRSPVANVYYDGRLGEITYSVNEEQLKGHLYSKRQYKIENGELISFQDVDLTTNDELLQEALSQNADNRLTEIVATIQQEQNEIIRAHLRQPVIVQGAAGSGKTTIALHRVSYFLYTMGRHFDPANLMILAPNNLFIDYIGDVLPELGVNKIHQLTYAEYIIKATAIKIKLQHSNTILEQLASNASSDILDIVRIKGSLFYKKMLDRYVQDYEQKIAAQFEDVFIEKYRIMKAPYLQKLFLHELHYLPIEKRLEKIKKIITSEVKRKTKAVLATINAKYDEALERAINGIRDDEKRRAVVTRFVDERDERIPRVKEESKHVVSTYMRKFPKASIKNVYKQIIRSKDILNYLAPEWSIEEIEKFSNAHQKDVWTVEDLAGIFYLQAKIKGIKDEWKMRAVFIDEVQDYSLFQLASLKEGLETDLFTMVGDLAQGIHSYRSFQSWDEVCKLFPRANFMQLQKSYRTTVEIMEEANDILTKMDLSLPKVQPVVRHGAKPVFISIKEKIAEQITSIYTDILTKGYESVAVITKNIEEAIILHQQLSNSTIPLQLLKEDSKNIDKNKLLIIPSHLSKGLEFDVAIVYTTNQFQQSIFEQKLLYVAMTRAMHELYLIGPNESAFK